jgi:hypothetical protein
LFTKGLFEYVFSTVDARKERERERERAREQMARPLPPSPWVLFIGEVEMVVYILFHWWG